MTNALDALKEAFGHVELTDAEKIANLELRLVSMAEELAYAEGIADTYVKVAEIARRALKIVLKDSNITAVTVDIADLNVDVRPGVSQETATVKLDDEGELELE